MGKQRLVMDIGGGSTELIIGDSRPKYKESMEMGCVSVTRRFFSDGAITDKRIKQAHSFALSELSPHIAAFKRRGWKQAIGASGSIRAIRKVIVASGDEAGVITLNKLQNILDQVRQVQQIDQLQLPGLSEERVPVFIGGLIILLATFEAMGIKKMEVSDRALREGLIYDLLGRFLNDDVRDVSISHLAERYHSDQAQAERITQTARYILAQVADSWNMKRTDSTEWLTWAAELHEIGLDIAHSRHHHHAAYIIENSDVGGFSRQEQQLLSALVRSHRRKLPLKLYKELPKRIIKHVPHLAVILRLAVILHRSRNEQPLPEFSVNVQGKNIELCIDQAWLDSHPLTVTDLEQEQKYLAAADFTLTLC